MQMTYAEKIEAQGVARGIEKGIEKGIERGIEQGRAEGMRALLAALLERRFGPLTEEAEKRLLAISSTEDLTRLHERALEAASLDDLDL